MFPRDKAIFDLEEVSSADSSLMIDVPLSEIQLKNKGKRILKSPSSFTSTTNQSLASDGSLLKNGIVNKGKESTLSSLKDALEINTMMRQKLREEITKLKVAAQKNAEKQALLKDITTEDKLSKQKAKPTSAIRAISVFAAPYFRDSRKMLPPINEDTKMKRRNYDVNSYLKPPKPWNHEENQKLLNGVTAFALMAALKPYKIRRDFLKSKLKSNKNLTDDDIEKLKDQIALVEQDIEAVSKSHLHKLLDNLNGKIDWMTISAIDMEGTRSPEDCERVWNNYLDFSINKEAFTPEEDERLGDLAEKFNERDWDTIAEELQTKRTAVQCFERYQTKLNRNLTKGYWSKEEDELLLELVEKYKVGEIIPWNKISLFMEGRTRQQIINRYERSLVQIYNRGPWTPEEDAILVACHFKFGVKWAKMKAFFQRRSTYSIRERYVNALDPAIKMGCWTKEEDAKLIMLIRRYGFGKWSKICRHIHGRTDNMCLVRANRLLEHSLKYHSDRGREIDTDINDPELFGRILRPIAPTKNCVNRNFKIKSCRETALEMCMNALETVDPSFVSDGSLDSIDFKLVSLETMHRVSDELHRRLLEKERDGSSSLPAPRYFTKPPKLPKRINPPLSDNEEMFQEEPVRLPPDQRRWTKDVLSTLFLQATKLLPPATRRHIHEHNSRERVELTLYKAFLCKQFECKGFCDEYNDLENTVFSGIDYAESLQTSALYFVQPPIYPNQSIITAPNLTTMGAMEVMEVSEPRLQDMSSFVHLSKKYLTYLCERTPECPKCLQCLKREEEVSLPQISQAEILEGMKKKFFATDETLEEAALVESGSMSLFKDRCSCEKLKSSLDSVQLLRKRLIGLFLWPALLASTKFSEAQIKNLCSKPRTEIMKNYFLRMNGGGRRRKNEYVPNRRQKSSRYQFKTEPTDSAAEGNNNCVPGTASDVLTNGAEASHSNGMPGKEKVQKRKASVPPSALRRSKRLCVLRRQSFGVNGEEQLKNENEES